MKKLAIDLLYEYIISIQYCIQGPDPECDKKCANKGWCKVDKMCQCKEGYMGQFCETALCFPSCMYDCVFDPDMN